MWKHTAALTLSLVLCAACSKKGSASDSGAPVDAAATTSVVANGTPASTVPASSAAPVAVAPVPAGTPPPDGKYERVIVDGVTVPMIHVMNNGAVVLVDTDGKKPRSWEEQYKRKRSALLTGQFDLHKTNTNKNETFEDDAIDKEGLWVIDAKGNISKH